MRDPQFCSIIEATAVLKIIIIEDDEALAKVYLRALTNRGYDVEDFTTAAYMLDFIEFAKIVPDLVITDLRLPGGMSGLDLAIELRARGYNGPILAVSGVADMVDTDKLTEAKFSAVVQKPLTLQELIELVENAIKGNL